MKKVIRNYNRFLKKMDRYKLERAKMAKQIFDTLQLKQIPDNSQTPKFIESLSYRKDLVLWDIDGLYAMYLQNINTWDIYKVTNAFMDFHNKRIPIATYIDGQEIDGNLFEQFMNIWGYNVVYRLVGKRWIQGNILTDKKKVLAKL